MEKLLGFHSNTGQWVELGEFEKGVEILDLIRTCRNKGTGHMTVDRTQMNVHEWSAFKTEDVPKPRTVL